MAGLVWNRAAAECSGVWPLWSLALRLAPTLARTAIVAGLLLIEAAQCKGVFPKLPRASRSAPAPTNVSMMVGSAAYMAVVQARLPAFILRIGVGSGFQAGGHLLDRRGCKECPRVPIIAVWAAFGCRRAGRHGRTSCDDGNNRQAGALMPLRIASHGCSLDAGRIESMVIFCRSTGGKSQISRAFGSLRQRLAEYCRSCPALSGRRRPRSGQR